MAAPRLGNSTRYEYVLCQETKWNACSGKHGVLPSGGELPSCSQVWFRYSFRFDFWYLINIDTHILSKAPRVRQSARVEHSPPVPHVSVIQQSCGDRGLPSDHCCLNTHYVDSLSVRRELTTTRIDRSTPFLLHVESLYRQTLHIYIATVSLTEIKHLT